MAAQRMAAEAASIDLVIAEQTTPDFDIGTRAWNRLTKDLKVAPDAQSDADEWLRFTKEMWAEDGARIHYRVLARLKGASASVFTLDGMQAQKIAGWRKTQATPVPLNELQQFLNQVDLTDAPEMGNCTRAIVAEIGSKYLVFRDAERLPLRVEVPIIFEDRISEEVGPAVVPVVSSDDPWPELVRRNLPRPRP